MLKGYGLNTNDFDITFDSEGSDDEIDTPTALESIASPKGYKEERKACTWDNFLGNIDERMIKKTKSKQIVNKVHRTEKLLTKFQEEKIRKAGKVPASNLGKENTAMMVAQARIIREQEREMEELRLKIGKL